MRILGWLADPGTIRAVCFSAVSLVGIVLNYRWRCKKIDSEHRLRCKEIEMLREERNLGSTSQPSNAVRGRRARRRMSR